MSLKAMLWGKYTDHAESRLDRLILMQLGDEAREEDHTGVVVYRASTSVALLAGLAVTDEDAVRAKYEAAVEQLRLQKAAISPDSHPYVVSSSGKIHRWDCRSDPGRPTIEHPADVAGVRARRAGPMTAPATTCAPPAAPNG